MFYGGMHRHRASLSFASRRIDGMFDEIPCLADPYPVPNAAGGVVVEISENVANFSKSRPNVPAEYS